MWILKSLVNSESVQALDALVPRGQVKVCMPAVARAFDVYEVKMWLRELLHQVFLPARVLTSLGEETYCMHRHILKKVRVFNTPEFYHLSA